jgi:hypothetical protein
MYCIAAQILYFLLYKTFLFLGNMKILIILKMGKIVRAGVGAGGEIFDKLEPHQNRPYPHRK